MSEQRRGACLQGGRFDVARFRHREDHRNRGIGEIQFCTLPAMPVHN